MAMTEENLATFERLTKPYLNPRRMQIMLLVAQGLTSEEISEQLSISKRTVEAHRSYALSALNVKSTTEFLCQILRG